MEEYDKSPLWLYRPLVNWLDVYRWCEEIGIKKIMPPAQLHATLATVRSPVPWRELDTQADELVVPAGRKVLQIFGWSLKALTFEHPRFKARHEELLARFPTMDHPNLRPHISLFKGGKMPTAAYLGELVLGPEIATRFEAEKALGIKHVKIADYL